MLYGVSIHGVKICVQISLLEKLIQMKDGDRDVKGSREAAKNHK